MSLVAQNWVQIGALAVIIVGALFCQAHYLNQRLAALESHSADRLSAHEKSTADRLAAFEASIDKRFDDLKLWIQSEFRRLDQRIDNLAEKIVSLEARVGKLQGRIEHPVLKG
jgi:hypothetical protein